MKDLSYALRTFRKNPGFTAVAIMALALGIGATSAMFSIIYSILFRNLPFQQPDRLAMIPARRAASTDPSVVLRYEL